MVEAAHGALQVPTRGDVIGAHRAGGGQVAAVFPIHHSRALLRAFDLLPVEIWGPPGREVVAADAHLQVYTCSIVRAGLSFLLDGGLDVVDLIVVPHGCDSLQGLGSVLIDFMGPDKPILPLYMPRGDGPDAVQFLADELGAMRARLADLTGRSPSDDQLMAAIEREERADQLLARLHAERIELTLSNREFYRVVRSREYLPAEDFVAVASAALEHRGSPQRGIPLLLSGVLPEPMALLDAIDEAGAVVAADDFICTGRRLYPAGTSPKPLRRMAARLLGGPPDSTRGSAVAARCAHLQQLARQGGVKAAVFYIVKFCEPEQFYLPLLRKALERNGVLCVDMEIDISEPFPHQATTRLEALLETVA